MTLYTDEHRELRSTVRSLLSKSADSAAVRATIEGPDGYDHALWKRLSAELGLPALAIPEACGGTGFGMVELAVACEEIGRANLPAPYLSTVLAGLALTLAEAGDPSAKLLGDIASGTRIATVHLGDGDIRIRDGAVHGTARHVPDAPLADTVVLVGSEGGVVIDLDEPGVTVTRLETMDLTRAQGEIVFEGAAGHPLRAAPDWAERLGALATVLLCCEQVGGTDRVLEMSTAHASERVQFGRPVGSFQAVKHTLADVLIELELARSVQQHAVGLAANETAIEDLVGAASTAKLACSQAFLQATSDTIRVHGGIGFTWEHDAHLYFRRARASAQLFGGPATHHDRVATHAGLGPGNGEAS